MIKVNIAEFLKILKITPSHQNIMLVGKHGIGKSEIIKDYFLKQKKTVISLFLGQMSDPGDLIGLPFLDSSSDRTFFKPPYWFPDKDEPIVLFLDELNRARPEILQSVMDLTLNKGLAGRKLPKGSQIIVAINEGDEYQLTDLDPALVSRFNIYHFSPSVQEWLLWASKNKIDKRIIDFIDKNRDCLNHTNTDDYSLVVNPNPRAWERVSDIILNTKDLNTTTEKLISGIIGVSTTLKFLNFIKTENSVNIQLLLSDFSKYKSKLDALTLHEFSMLNEALFRLLETEGNLGKLQKYIKSTEEYIRYLNDGNMNEALAHWISLYNSDAYPNSKAEILIQSPYLYDKIVEFIKNIDLE